MGSMLGRAAKPSRSVCTFDRQRRVWRAPSSSSMATRPSTNWTTARQYAPPRLRSSADACKSLGVGGSVAVDTHCGWACWQAHSCGQPSRASHPVSIRCAGQPRGNRGKPVRYSYGRAHCRLTQRHAQPTHALPVLLVRSQCCVAVVLLSQ